MFAVNLSYASLNELLIIIFSFISCMTTVGILYVGVSRVIFILTCMTCVILTQNSSPVLPYILKRMRVMTRNTPFQICLPGTDCDYNHLGEEADAKNILGQDSMTNPGRR